LYLGFGRGGGLEGYPVLGGSNAGDRRERESINMEADDMVSIADGVGSLFDEIVVVKFEISAGARSRLPRSRESEGFDVVKSEMDSEGIVMNAPPLAGKEGVVKAPKTGRTIASESKPT
jgi:hypothetical protein